MAKGRMIDKNVRKSKKLRALKSDKHRLLYFMIYPHVDVEGRFSADPEEIKIECVPLLPFTKQQITLAIIDLHEVGLINLYIINKEPYLEITRFLDFNKVRKDKEAESSIIPYSGSSTGAVQEYARISKVKLNISKVNERKEEERILFIDRKFKNIQKEDKERWRKTYPACDIDVEILKMESWLIANPKKTKSNYERFINSWLNKQQDQGGSKSGHPSQVGKDKKQYTKKEKDERREFLEFRIDCEAKATKKYQEKLTEAQETKNPEALEIALNLIRNETARLVNEGME